MSTSEDEGAVVFDQGPDRSEGDELVVGVPERVQQENDIELTGETFDFVEAGDIAAQKARRRRRL